MGLPKLRSKSALPIWILLRELRVGTVMGISHWDRLLIWGQAHCRCPKPKRTTKEGPPNQTPPNGSRHFALSRLRQPSCVQIIWRLDSEFLVTTCMDTLHKWSQNQPNIQRNRRPPCPIRSRPAKPQPKRTATQPNRSAPLFTSAQYHIGYLGVQPQAGKPTCARLAPSRTVGLSQPTAALILSAHEV